MADRKVLSASGFLLVAALFTGCTNTPQQQRFQNAFLPPVPHPAPLTLAEEPPVVAPNFYLSEVPNLSDVPGVSASAPALSAGPSRSDLLMQRAQQHFQLGKKYYQEGDVPHARTEFDRAVDLMLDASQNPTDRTVYEAKLEEMVDSIHRYDLAGMGSAASLDEPQFEKAPLEDILPMTFPVDPKLKTKVREQVQATVSQLPLTVNDAVLGYIHYFSSRRGHMTLVAGLRRAGRYRPLIQRILDEEGLPQELIHLAQAESGFLPRAMSRKAAAGMWQFVAWRGREYGLNRSRYSDDRLDPERATHAAARHLRDLYNEFGDWYLAIAAYDCGPGVIERAVERTGYADFFQLRNLRVLPLETTNYVPIILAMTIMSKNAAEYGLEDIQPDQPLEYDTVEMSAPTHLALVSDLTNTPVSELLALNPALLRPLAPDGYALHVPKGSGSYVMAALQMVPAERRASWRMHTVETGDTLASIGRRYKTSPSLIASANNIRVASPTVGDRLLIPAAYHEAAPLHTAVARRSHARHSAAKTGKHGRQTASKAHVRRAAGFRQAPAKLAQAGQK